MPSYYDRRNVDNVWTAGRQDDVMSGNGGNDIIRGAGGNDRIYGGDGNDQLYGDDGNDFLQGNAGTDVVVGGNGNDSLRGATGTDSLTGGGGADHFIFDYAADSRAGDGIDTIHDFRPDQGDVINISGTEEGYSYNQSFTVELVASVSALTHDHQQATLSYDAGTGRTTLNLYFGDGDPDIDMTLLIVGNHSTIDGLFGFYTTG